LAAPLSCFVGGKACRDQSRRNKQHNKNARCSTVQKLLPLAPDEAKAKSNTRVSDLSRCMRASQWPSRGALHPIPLPAKICRRYCPFLQFFDYELIIPAKVRVVNHLCANYYPWESAEGLHFHRISAIMKLTICIYW